MGRRGARTSELPQSGHDRVLCNAGEGYRIRILGAFDLRAPARGFGDK
jgi:hypothetical protein